MKLFLLSLTFLSSVISINLFAADDPVASITFSNPIDENKVSLYTNLNSEAKLNIMHKPTHIQYIPPRYTHTTVNKNKSKA